MRATIHLRSTALAGVCRLSLGWLLLGCPMDEAGSPEPTGLRVMTDEGPAAADFSCLGQRTRPSSSTQAFFSMPAFSFGQLDAEGNRVTIANLEVQVFRDNRVPESTACGSGCTLANHEGDGIYSFEASDGAWLAYRVLERPAANGAPAILRTVETNLAPGPDEALNTVLAPVLDGVHQALDIPRDESRTLVAGRFVDCNGDLVEGATISLRDTEGDSIATVDGTQVIYLDAMGPNPTLKKTPFSGQWSVTNVPVGESQVAVEVRASNGVLVACELAATAPDTLSVVRLHPLRADAPSVCTP